MGSAQKPEQSTENPALARAISAATTRVRLLRARQHGANGLLVGSALSAAALLAMRLNFLAADTFAEEWLFLPPLLGTLAGGLWGATRAVPSLAVLRFLEEKLDLKERLSTAHALSQNVPEASDGFLSRMRADAEAFTPTADALKKALPFSPVPRRVKAALLAAGATFLIWYLPTLPLFQSPATRAEKASLKREGERLVKIAKALEKEAAAKKLDAAQQAAKKLQALGQEMQKAKMTPQKAMMKAAELTEEMKKAQEQMAQQSAGQKSLPSAGRELDKALKSMESAGKPGEAGENKEGMGLKPPQDGGAKGENQNGKNKDSKSSSGQEAMKQSAKALAQNNMPSLAEQLSKLADQTAKGEPGDKTGQENLAKQLESLSKALQGTSLQKASEPLKEAADALKSGDMSKASEKLREAARRINEAAKNGEQSSAMQKMAEALQEGNGGQSSENPDMGDSGEGQGENDAFGKDGQKKGESGHKHTAECLKPGGT
jgi:hypothetical protein